MIIIVVFILRPRCCWTTFVLLLWLLFCPFCLSLLFFLLWVKCREMFECRTAALRGRRGCFGGSSHFQFAVFCKRILVKNVKKKKIMGLRLWEGGHGIAKPFSEQQPPWHQSPGTRSESDALLTTNHFTCGFLKLKDPRAGSQGKTGEERDGRYLGNKMKMLAIFCLFFNTVLIYQTL